MDNSLSTVYKKAAQNAPILGSLLQKVAQRTGARPISNYKNPETTVQKVEEKNYESPSRNYQLKDVNDVARGRLVYSSYDGVRKGVDSFKQEAKQAGLKVVKEQNFFTKPEEGYRGFHVDIQFPNGQHSEVQFHTPQSYANALATHAIHEQFGKEAPAPVEAKTEKIGNQIMQLPNESANAVSKDVEAKNAPAMQQAQQAAKQEILRSLIESPELEQSSYVPIHQRKSTPQETQNTNRGNSDVSVASPLPLQSQPSSVSFNPGV